MIVPDWSVVIAAFAYHVRTLRAVLGWSQQDLATVASLSQGAISRVERGTCLSLPLVTAGKILVAGETALGVRAAAPLETALAPAVRALFAAAIELGMPDGPAAPPPDPGLATLLRAYHALPPSRRAPFVRLVVPIAAFVAAPAREHAA